MWALARQMAEVVVQGMHQVVVVETEGVMGNVWQRAVAKHCNYY